MAEQIPGMAEAVAKRMEQVGLSPTDLERASGLSGPQAKQVRDGARKAYQHKTRVGIARALRWPLDWYDRLVVGEDPSTFEDVEHPDPRSVEDRLTALEQKTDAMASAMADWIEGTRR